MMRRSLVPIILILAVALSAGAEARLTTQVVPDEIVSIIDVIDILGPIREQVLSTNDTFTQADVDMLLHIARRASELGAPDLAAEARLLATLARDGSSGIGLEPTTEGLALSTRARTFDWPRSAIVMNIVGATGVVTLGTAVLFHFLSEQRYERFLVSDPLDAQLYQEFRSFGLLSTIFGATTVVTLGAGLPLAFSAPDLWTVTSATPTLPPAYTRAERDEVLLGLTRERERVVHRLQLLDNRLERRRAVSLWSAGIATIGLATSATFFFVADRVYNQYLEAPNEADATLFSGRVRFFDTVAIIGGFVAATGYGTTIGIEVFTNDRRELERRLNRINSDIVEVRLTPVIDEAVVEVPSVLSTEASVDSPENPPIDEEGE